MAGAWAGMTGNLGSSGTVAWSTYMASPCGSGCSQSRGYFQEEE